MSLRNPVGPLSPQVYWRRRLIVGGAALAVIIIILLIIFKPGGETPTPTPTGTETETSTETETGTETATGDAPACDPADIEIVPITDASSYASDEQPELSMSITNTGDAACSMNAGNSQQVLLITSGSDRIWSSADCQVNPEDQVVTFEPGVAVTTGAVAWDRTRSATDTCDDDRPSVTAGGASYHLEVRLGEISSTGENETKQFLLN